MEDLVLNFSKITIKNCKTFYSPCLFCINKCSTKLKEGKPCSSTLEIWIVIRRGCVVILHESSLFMPNMHAKPMDLVEEAALTRY